MAKCHRNNVASLVLDHHVTNPAFSSSAARGHHSRLRTAFSGSAFRRKFFDAVSCGGSSRFRHHIHDTDIAEEAPSTATTATTATISTAARTKSLEKRAKPKNGKSEKLSDLLSIAEAESEAETKKKVEVLEELKIAVRGLQAEREISRKEAACEVRLLAKEDSAARANLAMLGAIPPLVGMLEPEADADSLVASLYALLNIGIGNDANKAAIVKAGAVHKMLKITESSDLQNTSVSEAIVANFLGLTALDSNKSIIGSSGAIPFLVNTLKNLECKDSSQAKQDALRALYNLSIFQSNISYILDTGLIPFLMSSMGDMEVSERILSILSNVVSSPEGRKAISIVQDAFPILVDVLNWTDSPGCQEKASYILMVMAHKAYGDRQAMIEAGIMSSLLELTLLGSTLAQKRASRLLDCLRGDKGKQISENYGRNPGVAVSAPIYGSSSSNTDANAAAKEYLEEAEAMMSEENKAVKQLVQQSLQNNMRRIVKRANLPQEFVPSEHLKSLTSSSTSKSLPF